MFRFLLSFFILNLALYCSAAQKEIESELQTLISRQALRDSKISSSLAHQSQGFIMGEKVYLRPVMALPEDLKALVSFRTDKESMKYFGDGIVQDRKWCEGSLDRCVAANRRLPNAFNGFFWSLVTHDGVAGQIMIFNIRQPAKYPIEIGYWLAPDQRFRGKGLVERGAKLLLPYFETNLMATVHPKNSASLKILQNLGFIIREENVMMSEKGLRHILFRDWIPDDVIAFQAIARYKSAFHRK